MNASITFVLAALVAIFLGYKNYSLSTSLKQAQATISGLEHSVAMARKDIRDAENAHKTELRQLAKEKNDEMAELAALKDAEIAALNVKIEKAVEIMTKQKENLAWYKTEMKKFHDSMTIPGGRR
jgi:chromosome segregation ATPase